MDGELSLLSQALLRGALERALCRYLTRTARSRDILTLLTGKVIAVNAPPLIDTVYLFPTPGGIQLQTEFSGRPDLTLTATPLAFIKLGIAGLGRADMSPSDIAISGDPTVAEQMQHLFRASTPQWSNAARELATPLLADQASAWVHSMKDWSRETAVSLQQDLGEFLREEARAVPSPSEARDFVSGVDRLREECDRLEARIDRLQNLLAGTQDGLETF